jgi:hypothetical protein
MSTELTDYTPITTAEYLTLEGHSFEGQTRVVDNHNWTCWKTADGRLVRSQSQNVPDCLLTPEKLATSNAAKHVFDEPLSLNEQKLLDPSSYGDDPELYLKQTESNEEVLSDWNAEAQAGVRAFLAQHGRTVEQGIHGLPANKNRETDSPEYWANQFYTPQQIDGKYVEMNKEQHTYVRYLVRCEGGEALADEFTRAILRGESPKILTPTEVYWALPDSSIHW